MSTIPLWLEATRPKTLVAGLAPIFAAVILSSYAGFFDLQILLSTIATGMCIQIGTNFANDYFDYAKGVDNGERLGPRKLIVENLVSHRQMGIATLIAFALSIIFALPLIDRGGMIISILLSLAIASGIGYSAGRFSLSHLGLGDFFVVLFFGITACGMSYYLQTGVILVDGFIAGIAPGCISCGILTIDNLRDQLSDREKNKRTLVVRFGEQFGRMEYLMMMLFAFLTPPALYLFCNYTPRLMIADLAAIPALYLTIRVFTTKTPKEYAPLLPQTAALLVLYTVLFYIGSVL